MVLRFTSYLFARIINNVYDKQSGNLVRSPIEVSKLIKNYCFSQVAAFAVITLLQTFRPQSAFRIVKRKPVEIPFASLIYR